MVKNKHVIELNGRRYDAVSGTPLDDSKPAAAVVKPVKVPATVKVIDGIVASKAVQNAGRHAAHHAKSHQPQRAVTLMRSAVKKPAHSLKRHATVHTRTDILAKVPAHVLVPKLSWHHVDPVRLSRAKRIAQNKLVSRFGNVQASLTAPIASSFSNAIAAPSSSSPKPGHAASYSPSRPLADIRPPKTHHNGRQAAGSMDIFEQALQRANSHAQKAPTKRELAKHNKKTKGHKIISFSAAIAVVFVLTGFIAYENSANLTMKVTARKAGFSAHLPGYQPSGFAVSKFSYGAGAVAVNYKSTSGDDRAYQLNQQSSSWDSNTLLHEYVALVSKSHDTFMSAGRTVYTYGKDNATWVDNGIWYNVVSNGGLSASQLLDLAKSM